jgi:predicted small secreted protein
MPKMLLQNRNCQIKENGMKKSLGLILTVVLVTAFIAGCNMFKGAGKDVENAGKSIQKTVDKND